MKRQWFIDSICGLLILLFVYAGASKLLNFYQFTGDMYNQPFPKLMSSAIIWTLPSFEIIISLGLVYQKTRQFSLWASFILMSLFTVYTATVLLHFFSYMPCSCGGVIKKLTWPQHLVLNIFFVAISFIGIKINKGKKTREENLTIAPIQS